MLTIHFYPPSRGCNLLQHIRCPGAVLVNQCQDKIQQVAARARIKQAHHARIQQDHPSIGQHFEIAGMGIRMKKPLHEVLLHKSAKQRRGCCHQSRSSL